MGVLLMRGNNNMHECTVLMSVGTVVLTFVKKEVSTDDSVPIHLHHSGLMGVLCVENVARDFHSFLQRFRTSVAVEIIQNNV